ncbi:MAG: hypothetical protein L6Q57_09115 [Alphaproteobacteria bacterium]|nr:hypothetical protein [Alphaproteobacteria bacterium]
MTLWYLLDTTHADYTALMETMRLDHESRGEQLFTCWINLAGTQSFAKVQDAQIDDYLSPAILAAYDHQTQHACPPLTQPQDWEETE